MSGWCRVSVLLGAGLVFGLGCGGRTGALEDEFGLGADGAGASAGAAQAGKSSSAGKPGRGGTGSAGGPPSYAGVSYGGVPSYAGYPGGGYYGGGYPGGGYYGGGYPAGGYYGGGYPNSGGYGGTFPIAGTFTGGGFGGGPQGCGQCLLTRCNEPFGQCLQDFGCLSILSCMQSKGCQAFECYTDQYCRGTIDEWGGPAGQSMSSLLQTFSCAVQAGCECN